MSKNVWKMSLSPFLDVAQKISKTSSRKCPWVSGERHKMSNKCIKNIPRSFLDIFLRFLCRRPLVWPFRALKCQTKMSKRGLGMFFKRFFDIMLRSLESRGHFLDMFLTFFWTFVRMRPKNPRGHFSDFF